MTRTDEFSSPKLLLSTAQERSNRLWADERRFLSRRPFENIVEIDPETGFRTYKIKLAEKLDEHISITALEAFTHLRHALDHCMNSCARALKLPHAGGLYFPFVGKQAALEKAIREKCKGIPDEILEIVKSAKPYKGGDDLLWGMNRVAGKQKHDIVAPVAAMSDEMGFGAVAVDLLESFEIVTPSWDFEKEEMVYFRASEGTKFRYQDLTFNFYFALYNANILTGLPLLPILSDVGPKVRGIVSAIEDETGAILKRRGQ